MLKKSKLHPIYLNTIFISFFIGLFVTSLLQTISNITQNKNPDLVTDFLPWTAAGTSFRADQLIARPHSSEVLRDVSTLARRSLVAQAVNASALRALGLAEDANRQSGYAAQIMALATRVSRRELGAQLWLINTYARSDNIAATLEHYDTAMRTNYESHKYLFPVLAQAISDERLQTALVPYVTEDAPWLARFVDYIVSTSQHPDALAHILVRAGGLAKTEAHQGQEQALLAVLIAKKQYTEAHYAYQHLPGFNQTILSSAAINTASDYASAGIFGWQTFSGPTVGAAFANDGSGVSANLQAFAAPGERSLVARKLLFLDAGHYDLHVRYSNLSVDRGAAVIWQLLCAQGGVSTVLWQSDQTALMPKSSAMQAFVDVTQRCDAHYLDLTLVGGLDQKTTQLTVQSISFTRH
jgi:hypothetical protein